MTDLERAAERLDRRSRQWWIAALAAILFWSIAHRPADTSSSRYLKVAALPMGCSAVHHLMTYLSLRRHLTDHVVQRICTTANK